VRLSRTQSRARAANYLNVKQPGYTVPRLRRTFMRSVVRASISIEWLSHEKHAVTGLSLRCPRASRRVGRVNPMTEFRFKIEGARSASAKIDERYSCA